MATVIRLLRTYIGSLLAVVALLVTTVAIVMLVAMTMVWWQDGHLAEREQWTLRCSAGALAAGAFCTWAGIRLAYCLECERLHFGVKKRPACQKPFAAATGQVPDV